VKDEAHQGVCVCVCVTDHLMCVSQDTLCRNTPLSLQMLTLSSFKAQ